MTSADSLTGSASADSIRPRVCTAAEALAELQDLHDEAPNEATKRRARDLERRVREDVMRTGQHNAQQAQGFLAGTAEVVADAANYSELMSDLTAATGPVTDGEIDDWQRLDRDAAAVEQRLREAAQQAVWHAEKLVDPLASLSGIQGKFPTLKKPYLS